MAYVYATLIINGMRTYEQVKDSLKDAVAKELEKRGYDVNGKKL